MVAGVEIVREALRKVRRDVERMEKAKSPSIAALLKRLDKLKHELETPLIRAQRKKRR